MFWVAATLWDTSISVYETLVEPLSLAEKEQYYSETKRFCRLFGLSDSDMPSSWSRFRVRRRDVYIEPAACRC